MNAFDREPAVLIQISPTASEVITYSAFVETLAKPMGSTILDLLHGAVGTSGESGELLDAVKKCWVYQKDLDVDNVIEELGDLRFYMQVIMNTLHISEYQVLSHNAAKLSKRYAGLKYSDSAAQTRADKVVDSQFGNIPGTDTN